MTDIAWVCPHCAAIEWFPSTEREGSPWVCRNGHIGLIPCPELPAELDIENLKALTDA